MEGAFLGLDALGLLAHHVLGDASFEVQFEELGLLVFQGLQAAAMACGGLLDDADVLLGKCRDRVADLLDLLWRELQGPVERGDLDLDSLDAVVAAVAGAAVAAFALDAAEVFVDAANAAVLAVDQACAAVLADQAALEVVVVLAVAIARLALGVEMGLDAVEDLLVDQLGVTSFGPFAHVDDDPDVVGIAQHLGYCGPGERARGELAGRACCEPVVFESVTQAADGVLAGGVQIEGELHERGSLLVDDDGVDEPSLELDRSVFVADRRRERRAACLVLLDLALANLVGEVLVLVLREGCMNAVVELAGRRGVDVLQHRDELCACLTQPVVDDGVVHRVTPKAIELVHDDVVDIVAALDVGDHFHESRPVASLCSLGEIHVAARDHGAQFSRLSFAGLTLRGDRVALLAVPALHLLIA